MGIRRGAAGERGGERPALLWERSATSAAVRCNLCAHRCLVRPGRRGICGVRVNTDGELRTLVYGQATNLAVDPIEKKPLFHFRPGARALSVATVGCNFSCLHCQNHTLSQWPREHRGELTLPGEYVAPEDVVAAAVDSGSQVIAYTYTEPTIYLEWALDTARLAAARGIDNVFVTNGYLTAEAVELVAPVLHGANVDLKGLDDRLLRREVKAVSGPVIRTIRDLWQRGLWVEVTTLVIPGSNDDDAQLRAIAELLAGISPDLPWHVSRFHPLYRMPDRPPTPARTLERALRLGAEAGLRHVYAGNLRLPGAEDTRCPGCGVTVIARHGFQVTRVALAGGPQRIHSAGGARPGGPLPNLGYCVACGHAVAGRGLP